MNSSTIYNESDFISLTTESDLDQNNTSIKDFRNFMAYKIRELSFLNACNCEHSLQQSLTKEYTQFRSRVFSLNFKFLIKFGLIINKIPIKIMA